MTTQQTSASHETKTPSFELYEHQIAGHLPEKGGRGILVNSEEKQILKPLKTHTTDNPNKSTEKKAFINNEIRFYEEHLKHLPIIEKFVPKYYGVREITDAVGKCNFIVLENLTADFKHPCTIDLKIGTQTYTDTASKEKKEYELLKYPLQHVSGFRISGMKVWDHHQAKLVNYDRHWGRNQTPEKLLDALQLFFAPLKEQNRLQAVMPTIIAQIEELHQAISKISTFRFIASSLLLIYEGDADANYNGIQLKLIDFAHGHKVETVDEGVLKGLSTLLEYCKVLMQQ